MKALPGQQRVATHQPRAHQPRERYIATRRGVHSDWYIATAVHCDHDSSVSKQCESYFFSFRLRVAWSSRPPCSIVAGYACSHPYMVFNRVVSLLAVGLVVVGSLENSWLVGVIRLSCVWHIASTRPCFKFKFNGLTS